MQLSTFKDVENFKEQLTYWLKAQLLKNDQPVSTIFISYGSLDERCKVWHSTDVDHFIVIKRAIKFLDQYYEKNRQLPALMKFDVVSHTEEKSWQDVDAEVNNQKHNNHYRKGISFDENFNVAFLEQEIYGKALIKGLVYNKPNFFDEININNAIKAKYPILKKTIKLTELNKVWVFDTTAVFYENGEFVALQSTGPENGVRFIQDNKKAEIKDLILKNADFLHREILDSGCFVYGYFPAYNRELRGYNTVRHCTAVYALLETLEVEYNQNYLPKIKKAIQYAIDTFYREVNDLAFMIDGVEPNFEVKLGSNAAAIFMFAKYQEITKDDQYQPYAENLAKGIRHMVNSDGETTHVLHFPSLEEKEKFRIVYYDGEAALGLLRLYQLNGDENLLELVKLMFEHFILKGYEKYHDHWLSYCTNELTKICPEEKYFKFGLSNYLKHMKFILNRKTAYATFLEMMMSAYKMIQRIKELNLTELYEQAQLEELSHLIEHRVEFQRSTGFFYPEVAMYTAKPSQILNAFYVRHDRFRTRIDDQEHNLSGFVAYLNYFEKQV